MLLNSLWGEEFDLPKEDVGNIISKIKKPKEVKSVKVEDIIKSKRVSLDEKLEVIASEVNRILGNYKNNIKLIRDYNEFVEYIDKSIENGVISIDTETNNSTDPFTCKIMGLCLYTPNEKYIYVPVNHINRYTGEKLKNQITEEQINEQLSRLKNTRCIFQNGKFDYLVIYVTCGVKLPITWDTMIGSQLLNENEPAGLKYQYRDKIDKDQEKYSIEHLFGDIPYEVIDPALFALYAATDSYITYMVYLYQKKQFELPGNEKLYNLFLNIEMPIVTVTSEMELRGVSVDKEFAQRLSKKFHLRLDQLNDVISKEMEKYSEVISEWKLTPKANEKPVKNGKPQKSMVEQLSDPIDLNSPLQLGILLYDILKVLKLKDKKTTDENALLSIKDTLPLASMILKKREYEKYLGTYIDVLPTYCSPYDNRVHAKFNQLGREDRNVVTGRFSSSDPSLQVIPARGDIVTVRCMFTATTEYPEIESKDGYYSVPIENEVLLSNGEYKWSSELKSGEILNTGEEVEKIEINNREVIIYIK